MLLLAIGMGWLAGLTATLAFNAQPWFAPLGALPVLPLCLALDGRRGVRSGLIAATFAFGASLNAERVNDSAPTWTGLVGQDIVVEGRIITEPDPGPRTVTYVLEVDRVVAPVELEGSRAISLVMPQYLDLRPGDRVIVRGTLELPGQFDDFNYRDYLRDRGIFGSMFRPEFERTGRASDWRPEVMASEMRLAMERSLQEVLPEPQASLAAGIAFGRDQGLSRETRDAFQRSGLAHLVAVSGSNVTLILLLIAWALASRAGRRWSNWLSVGAVVLYVVVAGLSWSIIRAGVMAIILVGAWFAGRQRDGVAALSAAFVAITLVQPSAVRDPGFQLSFAAMGGILVFAPWLTAGMRKAGSRPGLRPFAYEPAILIVSLSLVASISTLPVMAYHFERLTLAGLVTNLLAAPLFALCFAGAWLTVLAALLSPVAGWAVALAAYLPLAALTWLAEWGADLPGSAVPVVKSLAGSGLAILALLLLGAFAHRRLPPSVAPAEQWPRGILLPAYGGIAGVIAVFALLSWQARAPAALRIDILDVGQGDAILVTTPGGAQILVDGGAGDQVLAAALGEVMPFHDRSLDAVILTHADEDHIGGLPGALDRFAVGAVYDNGSHRTTPTFAVFAARAGERETIAAGWTRTVDGVRFEAAWPMDGFSTESTNEASIVIRLTYQNFSMLLTGDLQGEGLGALLESQQDIASAVLKVPHHGSNTTPDTFIHAVGPVLAIIPVGCSNPYGHPAEGLMAALDGVPVVRTDTNGNIRIESDGSSISVSTEHPRGDSDRVPGPAACR